MYFLKESLMRKIISLSLVFLAILTSCSKSVDYSGTYTGYSWGGETSGTSLEDAKSKIETTLTLDKNGVIQDAKLDFLAKNSDGSWRARNNPEAQVQVDFSVTPTAATPQAEGQEYKAGNSMFKISANDKMGMYAVAVDTDGTVAFAIVDPLHRYQTEMKLGPDFDLNRPISSVTIASGELVPTTRTSGSGSLKPKSWDELADKNIFSFYEEYIYTMRGTFEGLTAESPVAHLLERAGVSFADGKPQALAPFYGYYGSGGWEGNYNAIAAFLKGKKATELPSLVNWSSPRYSKSIGENKVFGIVSGATRTVQNSADGIAGATVRMSRESQSYQRALVAAGILQESDVIKGRF